MPLTTYTRDELRNIVLDHIRGRVPGANTARYSDYWMLATGIATVVHGDQAAAQYLVQQILPSTAEKRFLDAHAALRQLTRLPAAKARGKVLVQATALSSIAAGLTLTHASGRVYTVLASALASLPGWSTKTVAPGTSARRLVVNPDAVGISVDSLLTVSGFEPAVVRSLIPATGTPVIAELYRALPTVPGTGVNVSPTAGAVVQVEAELAGAAGNLEAGDLLPFDSPPAGVTGDQVVLEMSGGGDLESDEELRARLLAWLAERPGSGNRSDYRHWCRETPDVRLADAFVYPAYRGLGTVDVVPLGISGARATGTVVNDLVQAHLEDEASFQDDVLTRQLADASPIAVSLQVRVAPGYEPDFVPAAPIQTGLVQPDLDRVRLGGLPSEVEIGDRVLVMAGDKAPRLYQRAVIGKSAGFNELILDEDLPDTPTPSVNVYPGGPNAQAIIDAIVELFDGLGPGDTSPATRFPSPGEAYPDELPLARLDAVVMGVEGVLDLAIGAPVSDQAPATLQRLSLGQLTLELTTSSV